MEIVQSLFNLFLGILEGFFIIIDSFIKFGIIDSFIKFGLNLFSIAYRHSDTIIIGFIPTIASLYFAKKKKNHSYGNKSDDCM